jgi:hypothetical protein
VRIEDLSDHVGLQQQQAAHRLKAAKIHAAEVRRELFDAELALEVERQQKVFWRRLLAIKTGEEQAIADELDPLRHRLEVAEARLRARAVDLRKLDAGADGEQVLPRLLTPISDRWTLFNGYRNPRGEIDHVLLGPKGLWAIEVKNRRIQLEVDGRRWWLRRLDREGKPIGDQAPAVDGGGRDWGRQVGEPGLALAERLAARGHDVPVRTAVVLVDAKARVTRCIDAGVDLVTHQLQELIDAITTRPVPLDDAQRDSIRSLIRQDHAFHERRLAF